MVGTDLTGPAAGRQALLQRRRRALDLATSLTEQQHRSRTGGQRCDPVPGRVTQSQRRHGTQSTCRQLDPNPRRTGCRHRDNLALRTGQPIGQRARRTGRGRKTDTLQRSSAQLLESHQRQREMGAAFAGSEHMKFVQHQRLDRSQHGPTGAGAEQHEQRLRGRRQQRRRMSALRRTLHCQRIATAQFDPKRRIVEQLGQLHQWRQVVGHVAGQRFQWRDMQRTDAAPPRRLLEEAFDQWPPCRQGLALSGGCHQQGIAAGTDQGPGALLDRRGGAIARSKPGFDRVLESCRDHTGRIKPRILRT